MLRRQVKQALLPKSLRSSRLPFGIGRGLMMEIDFQNQLLTYFGLYEIELNGYLKQMCHGARTCFDVGASVGYDTLVMATLSGGRVVAFDCDDDAIKRFKANVALNPVLQPHIEIHRHLINDGRLGGRSLDDLVEAGLPVPDLLKVDVEGSEAQVLAGARGILARRMPGLLVEVHSLELEHDCMALLADTGYRPTVVERRTWLAEQRPIPHNRWLVAKSPSQ